MVTSVTPSLWLVTLGLVSLPNSVSSLGLGLVKRLIVMSELVTSHTVETDRMCSVEH